MVSLKTLQCPRCGASVQLDAAGERASCSFCGTVAYSERAGLPGAPIVVVKSHLVVVLALSIGLLGLLIALSVVFYSREPSAVPVSSVPASPSAAPAPHDSTVRAAEPRAVAAPSPSPSPPPVPLRSIASYVAARLVDTNEDLRHELLVPVQRAQAGKHSDHFAVYELPSLELLRETVALDDPQRALSAVAHNRLVLAQPSGELAGYDLASGDRQWITVLGERVAALCAADAKLSDALHVTTEDGRNLLVDVMTGRQNPVRTGCAYPLAVAAGRTHPSDRRDYRAPRTLRAFRCGSVRVMGSADYRVPDACKSQLNVDSDRLDGMVAHAVWRLGARNLLFGVRAPGAYVPMVAVRQGARWLWKSAVPLENPLAAEQGGPRIVSLHEQSLVIAYAEARQERHWLTNFRVADGARVWTVEIPKQSAQPLHIVQTDEAVVLHTSRALHVLSAADGGVLATVASP